MLLYPFDSLMFINKKNILSIFVQSFFESKFIAVIAKESTNNRKLMKSYFTYLIVLLESRSDEDTKDLSTVFVFLFLTISLFYKILR